VRGVRGENGDGGIDRREGLKGAGEILRGLRDVRSGMLNKLPSTSEQFVSKREEKRTRS